MSTDALVFTPGAVVAQDLHCLVDGCAVLRGVDITVAPGEAVGVLGRGDDAAAPPALLQVLAGLTSPRSGWIQWGGQDLLRLRDSARSVLRRRDVGTALDCTGLIPTLPVLENVGLPLLLDGHSQRSASARAADLLDAVGLSGAGARRVDRLTLRERALVVVGRALVTEPRLVLAHHRADLLDRRDAEAVADALLTGCSRIGASLVLGTADPSMAARCARQVEIVEGRVRVDLALARTAR